MLGMLNFMAAFSTQRIAMAQYHALILAFLSIIQNPLKRLSRYERQWIGLSVSCLMAMNSFLFFKSGAVLNLCLPPKAIGYR